MLVALFCALDRKVPRMSGTSTGYRVSVFWDGNKTWFSGTVVQECPDKGYLIHYDDGEVHRPRLLQPYLSLALSVLLPEKVVVSLSLSLAP